MGDVEAYHTISQWPEATPQTRQDKVFSSYVDVISSDGMEMTSLQEKVSTGAQVGSSQLSWPLKRKKKKEEKGDWRSAAVDH
jgi:hypothetical protein